MMGKRQNKVSTVIKGDNNGQRTDWEWERGRTKSGTHNLRWGRGNAQSGNGKQAKQGWEGATHRLGMGKRQNKVSTVIKGTTMGNAQTRNGKEAEQTQEHTI
jgi:hypothetical protein